MEKTQDWRLDEVVEEVLESTFFVSCRLFLRNLAVLVLGLSIVLVFHLDAGAVADSGALSASSEAHRKGTESKILEKIIKMEPEEQISYLKELEKKGDRNGRIPFYIGNAMYNLGRLDSAGVYFEKALAIDPSFSRAYVNLGLVLEATGKPNEAKLKYNHAIKVNPNDVLAHCHLGFMSYSKKNYTEAMNNYRKALKIDPENAQVHYYLGLAFADAHIFKEALREWELVAKLDPDGELGKTARENAGLIRQYMSVKVPR